MACNYCGGGKQGQAKLGWFCGGKGRASWRIWSRRVTNQPVIEVECSNTGVKDGKMHGFKVSLPAKFCPNCGGRL